MSKYQKPKLWLIVVDLIAITANTLFVFLFLPLTTSDPFNKYALSLFYLTIVWVIVSFLFNRYKKLVEQGFFNSIFSLLSVTLITFLIFGAYIYIEPSSGYSEYVLVTILVGIFLTLYLFIFFYNAFKYATQVETVIVDKHNENEERVKTISRQISKQGVLKRKQRIIDFSGEKIYDFLEKNLKLNVHSTLIMTHPDALNDNESEYKTAIQLELLNSVRGINKMFVQMNDALSKDGRMVCCYKSQTTTKQNIFKKYPRVIADIIYFGHFMVHRLLPKLFLTDKLYFDFTDGRNRTLSKTEVLGRLNYCGFQIERVAKVNDLHVVIARKVSDVDNLETRRYGPLIKLSRFGKNGKLFNVYKFRTMHPYSEFLQEYVYEQSSLAEGGKFRHDIRVTTAGRLMRKYWIDELPMIYNLLKRDMKLVGVRPLSKHYFSLYSKELQNLRIQHKPGLLPPFYADMPKTLEEIEASEMHYLNECNEKGTLRTDIRYFFIIVKNIVFRKARSA